MFVFIVILGELQVHREHGDQVQLVHIRISQILELISPRGIEVSP